MEISADSSRDASIIMLPGHEQNDAKDGAAGVSKDFVDASTGSCKQDDATPTRWSWKLRALSLAVLLVITTVFIGICGGYIFNQNSSFEFTIGKPGTIKVRDSQLKTLATSASLGKATKFQVYDGADDGDVGSEEDIYFNVVDIFTETEGRDDKLDRIYEEIANSSEDRRLQSLPEPTFVDVFNFMAEDTVPQMGETSAIYCFNDDTLNDYESCTAVKRGEEMEFNNELLIVLRTF